jgi:hypothetical protein
MFENMSTWFDGKNQEAAVRIISDTQQGGGGCSRKLITNP